MVRRPRGGVAGAGAGAGAGGRRRGGGWSQPRWADFTVEHPRLVGLLRELRAFLPPLNFITIHYAYFIVVTLLTSVVFWGSSNPAHSISYVDSLFLTVSAMTEAGLNTVNLSQMTTWQQVLLWLLILFGGAIWVSIWTVAFRLQYAFEKRFDDIVRAESEKRDRARQQPASSHTRSIPIPFFRTLKFGKATTTPPGDPTLAGFGSKLEANGINAHGTDDDMHTVRRPASLPPGLDAMDQQPLDVQGSADDASPSAQARITFADDPRGRELGLGSRDARSTASIYASDSRPRRRNVDLDVDVDVDHGKPTSKVRDQSTDPSSHVHNFLTSKTVGRNAQFHNLTTDEREQLGGCEYRALKVLSIVVPLYFVLWQLLGCIALGAWIANNNPEVAISNGLNPWWTGIFFGVSAFNNSGMALLDANMIPFQNSYFVLIVMGAMILPGNTAYPILLRFIFWSMLKVLSCTTDEGSLQDFKETLRFILKYPRRVYTNMFPAPQTWWLLFMVCLLNVTDWVAFEVLNLGNPIIDAIPVASRIIDGLFQGIAVRSGGFYIVAISNVYIGLQILYVIMMYISVYPVVITMRHSNVYEERSLGIYADDPEPETDVEQGNEGPLYSLDRQASSSSIGSALRRLQTKTTKAAQLSRALKRHFAWHGVGVAPREEVPDSHISFISQQIHGQLAHDIWWLVLAVLVISIIETSHFLGDPTTYSVFNIIFEVVSAYGTVGISTGLPNAAYSFSGGWYPGSKLVLCLVMLRGRHRGLPVALDRAVRLPGEQLHRDEEEDYRIRRSMTSRRMSVDSYVQ